MGIKHKKPPGRECLPGGFRGTEVSRFYLERVLGGQAVASNRGGAPVSYMPIRHGVTGVLRGVPDLFRYPAIIHPPGP